MIEGDQAAEDGFLPDGETDTVTVLEGERSFLIGEAEFFRLRPELDDLGSADTWLDRVDGLIQDVPAIIVGIYLRLLGTANDIGAMVDGEIVCIADIVTVVSSVAS